MQDDFDRELQNYFTDVEHLREMFRQWLAAPTLPKRMLVIHGVGGVGKSSLLRMFRLHCKSVGVPVALASGDEQKSALDVLTRWADDLKADGVRLPEFSKTFQHYRAVQAKVENEATKLAGKLAKSAAATVVETVASTIPGIGPLLGKLGGMGAEALVDWLRGFLTKPDIDLLLDPAKKLTADFLTDLQKAANRRRIVLMLDTFEQMTALEDWAREVAQQLPANVLLVIAGRALPNWSRAWPGWIANAQVEELKPMSEDDMRELVRRYYATLRGGEPDPKQVEAIIRFARGLPLAATAVIHAWIKYPDQMGDFQAVKSLVIADVVDWLMKGIPEGLKPALEAAAIVRWFDQPILRAVMAQEDVRDAYNELRRFPFVRTRAEGLALHDAVREIMDENLRVQDAERHRELHERAAAYFEKRLEKATGEDAERLGLERLYHRIRADEETGIQLFQEMAEELVRYRLVNRLRALLNDVNTYPLERENSRLWREYYETRILHLENQVSAARERYERLISVNPTDLKLRAYVMADYGDVLRQLKKNEQAISYLEKAISAIPIDTKLVWNFLQLAGGYRRLNRHADAWAAAKKVKEYCAEIGDRYGLLLALDRLESFYTEDGDFRQADAIRKQRLEILASLQFKLPYMEMFVHGGLGFYRAQLSGRYHETEQEIRKSVPIARELNVTNLVYILKDLGYVLGLQGKYIEAEDAFNESLSISAKFDPVLHEMDQAGTDGFWGYILDRQGRYKESEKKLLRSLETKKRVGDVIGIPELYIWLGELIEIRFLVDSLENKLELASSYYSEAASLVRSLQTRHYFRVWALTGLIRVKHAQGDYAAIPPLLAEAEQLAQQYEYNDHLASLRLTQGHIAWEGNAPTWENGFDAALRYYQHALIYALRYNRFLLDEVLSGRPQGTPLRPIIPECLKRGEEGRRMLIALRDWWQTGVNDIGTPRPDTISPIPEGIPLLEAERIAREREPGDGSPQKTVLEQIEAALEQIG
jgi:tetratricopeptide (TPR) repeat protein